MNNFIKAFLSFGLATSIEKILGFILLPIYTRYFSTEVYGAIEMMSTILSLGTVFSLLQLETSLQRYYYQYDKEERGLIISNIYGSIFILSISISILIYLFSENLSIYIFGTDTYHDLFSLISLQLPLANLSMLGLVLLRFEQRNLDFLKVILVKVFFNLLFTYLFVVLSENKLHGVFFAQIISLLLSTSLVTFYVRKDFVLRFSMIFQKIAFRYALPQVPARVGSVLLAQANRFFILGYLSLSAMGLYSVSLKLASSIQIINSAFILAWTPFMHKQFQNENNKETFKNILPLLSAVVFLCVSLVTLYSREIVMLVTTEDFYTSHKYIGGLAFFFALYILKEVVDIGPKIREKTIFVSYIFFISVIVNLVSLYFLTEEYQLEGVVVSMMTTNLVLLISSWFVSNLLYPIDFSISRFFVLLLPCLLIVFLVLLTDVSLSVRAVLSLIVLIYYGLFFRRDYYTIKMILN